MEKVHSIFKNLGPDMTHFHSHSFGETSHVALPGWKRGLVNASLSPDGSILCKRAWASVNN